MSRGTCQICGCTDNDCSQCIEASGEACYWIDDTHELCSRCVGKKSDVYIINTTESIYGFKEPVRSKLIKEASDLELKQGESYNYGDLQRYCFVRGLKMYGSFKMLKKGMECYERLLIKNNIFTINKVDGFNYHVTYQITETFII